MDITKLVPSLSIDCVIFGFHENELKVLLLKLKNADMWALPGGFVEVDKDVNSEAVRVLESRTGLNNIFLKQFQLFGKAGRTSPEHTETMIKNKLISEDLRDWFNQRFVTVGYYALVEYSKVKSPKPDLLSESCEWKSLTDLPNLMLDHHEIISKAHETLKKALNDQPIGINLLPELFSMPELQALYETVLGKELDRRNFRRKMLAYDILIQTDERRMGGAHKPPLLYKFDKDKYSAAIENGLQSIW